MPPVISPKPSRGKKGPVQPKAKGAVRAKSGCYTCRIRRKKCDEGNPPGGPCDTCSRLKLQCLGYGAKRPDNLRDPHIVSRMRENIKTHLAAQGMIKGHAGSGSRSTVNDDVLQLDPIDWTVAGPTTPFIYTNYSGDSSSPASSPSPLRENSVDSDQGPFLLRAVHPSRHHMLHYDNGYDRSDMMSRCDSPVDPHPDFDPRIYTLHPETPATRSTFSRNNLYNEVLYSIDPDPEPMLSTASEPLVSKYYPSAHVPFELIDVSVQNYVNNVVKIQYLLGDKSFLPDMIWTAISQHNDSHMAVSLLSTAYHGRQENPRAPVLQNIETKSSVDSLRKSLTSRRATHFSADDALTALHVISLFLFDGGMGKWEGFIELASIYVMKVLDNPLHFHNYPAALLAATQKDEFIVKTTIWFDVLASVTTHRPPRLLLYIRDLFRPDLSYVGAAPPNYSMLSPMGCENIVVWALAETCYLAYWKKRLEAIGELSIPELVHKVQDIEIHLNKGPLPINPHDTAEEWARYFTSEIFRTATKLFLKTVESGDFPHVSDIRQCVNDTFWAIMNSTTNVGHVTPSLSNSSSPYLSSNIDPSLLSATTFSNPSLPTFTPNGIDNVGESRSAIVRSTVFGIYICGCLTNDLDQRRQLVLHLEQNSGLEGVGNCSTILNLLRSIWDGRANEPARHPVFWRKILKQNRILLV